MFCHIAPEPFWRVFAPTSCPVSDHRGTYLILRLLCCEGVCPSAGWSLGGGVGAFCSLGQDGPGDGFEVTVTSC
ncbi:hypothetical protein DPMN_138081 [Dreissena polymorpha]|uniref:Uncharacterized protein n=1 Tax=Dreissena polymorpha TaxID=45954 RepID=A0A9D4JFA2_DREPO|nr:hypothetical protein DPMN_138081 [Dreissena polymorpha]